MPTQSSDDRNNLIREQIFAYIRQEDARYATHTDEQLRRKLFLNSLTLRLTKEGWHVMRKHFEHEVFEVDKEERLSGRDLIALHRKMAFPYFLSKNKLYLFSSKDIFVLKLHGDDLKKWLKKLHDKS